MIRLFLFFILIAQSVFGATYYVDFSAGSDAAAGTQGAPWRTLPGTRKVDDSGYQSATYGGTIITTVNKVQAGDIFKLKSGTTHGSANGGFVLINSTYYVTTATKSNPITIERDSTWGSGGEVMIDGLGMTLTVGGFGLFHITVGGLKINGGTDLGRRGIVFYRSTFDGISAYPLSGPIQGPDVYNCYFSTNGTAYASSGDTTEAGLRWLQSYGPAFAFNCEFNGGSNQFQGICSGDSSKPCDILVSNCLAYAHKGNNDEGIGMKGFGTNMVYKNCTNWFNYKGWDLGCKQSGGPRTVYKVLNSLSMSNENGINMNGPPNSFHPYAGPVDFYIINCVIHDCPEAGSRIYHGPFNFNSIGNLYYRCGGGVFGTGNLGVTADNSETLADDGIITNRIYNTILYKPSGTYCNLFVENYCTNNFYNMESDYNSWTRTASEDAIYWSGLSAGTCWSMVNSVVFSYGGSGPGYSSGNWYDWYAHSTVQPYNSSIGHFHSDSHSRATGGIDSTPPPFTDVSTFNFALTNSFSGIGLSGQPWFIPEMGVNGDGTPRKSTPDMGPQDVDANILPPLKGPQLLRRFRLKLR